LIESAGVDKERFVKKLGIAAAILVMLSVGAFSAAAMSHGDAKIRIYWTSSGLLGPFSILDVLTNYPKDQDRQVMMPVVMFIIDHPKGLIVFDTGNNALPPGPHRQHRNVSGCHPRDPEEGVVPGLVAGEVPARRRARHGRL
jgi:hypothetical protein